MGLTVLGRIFQNHTLLNVVLAGAMSHCSAIPGSEAVLIVVSVVIVFVIILVQFAKTSILLSFGKLISFLIGKGRNAFFKR